MIKVLSRNSSLGSSGSAKAAAGSESPIKGVGVETPTAKKSGLGKFFGKLSKSPKKSPVKSSSSGAETPKTESSPMSTQEVSQHGRKVGQLKSSSHILDTRIDFLCIRI